ncbi:MAG: hypothetical protein ACLFQ4_10215 [Halanaerobium sp.]
MSLVTLKSVLDPGVENKYAVGAFYVSNHLLFESVFDICLLEGYNTIKRFLIIIKNR